MYNLWQSFKKKKKSPLPSKWDSDSDSECPYSEETVAAGALAKHLMQYHNSFLQYFSNNNNKTITAFLKLGWFNFVFCFIPFSFANIIKFEEKENKIWRTNKIKPQHCQPIIKMYFLHYFSTGKRYNDRQWFGVDLMGVKFNWRPWLLTKNMTNNKPFLMPFTLHKNNNSSRPK